MSKGHGGKHRPRTGATPGREVSIPTAAPTPTGAVIPTQAPEGTSGMQRLFGRYSSVALGALGVFILAAIASGIAFGAAALDGERRRDEVLVHALRPDYTGDNRLAPDFSLPDRTGRTLRLSALRGKTVVLHFWSRDCPPCVQELTESLPAMDEILRDRHDVVLVLVNVDAGWDAIAPLVPVGFRSPILFDPTRRVVGGLYGTRLFPETWVIDPRGVIRARFDRTLEWDSTALLDYITSFR